MPRCRLLMDGACVDRNDMPNRGPRILRMRSFGVEVRLHRSGRLHQKSLLADKTLYVGSGNFSEATLRNVELGAVITLTPVAASEELEAFDALCGSALGRWM